MATLVSIRQKCIFNRFERFWPFNILGFATNRFLRRVFQSLFGLLAVAVRRLGPLFGLAPSHFSAMSRLLLSSASFAIRS